MRKSEYKQTQDPRRTARRRFLARPSPEQEIQRREKAAQEQATVRKQEETRIVEEQRNIAQEKTARMREKRLSLLSPRKRKTEQKEVAELSGFMEPEEEKTPRIEEEKTPPQMTQQEIERAQADFSAGRAKLGKQAMSPGQIERAQRRFAHEHARENRRRRLERIAEQRTQTGQMVGPSPGWRSVEMPDVEMRTRAPTAEERARYAPQKLLGPSALERHRGMERAIQHGEKERQVVSHPSIIPQQIKEVKAHGDFNPSVLQHQPVLRPPPTQTIDHSALRKMLKPGKSGKHLKSFENQVGFLSTDVDSLKQRLKGDISHSKAMGLRRQLRRKESNLQRTQQNQFPLQSLPACWHNSNYKQGYKTLAQLYPV
jgi:regulator of replication initiation timing